MQIAILKFLYEGFFFIFQSDHITKNPKCESRDHADSTTRTNLWHFSSVYILFTDICIYASVPIYLEKLGWLCHTTAVKEQEVANEVFKSNIFQMCIAIDMNVFIYSHKSNH